MFRDTRRKKLRNRLIFSTAGALVLAGGLWLNFQSSDEEIPVQDAAQDVRVQQEETQVRETGDDSVESDENKEIMGTDTESSPETYLIKEVEGVVKVFILDENGGKELYLITSIPYDLLSESDQQLFTDGVELDTEEDLGKFLESFDS